MQFSILRLDRVLGMERRAWHFHERLDDYYYMLRREVELWIPKILGTDFSTLGLRLTLDAAMLGVGGLMGIRVSTSVVLGTVVQLHGPGADHDRARRHRTAGGSPPARGFRSLARRLSINGHSGGASR